ncbi:Ketosteroid isomerase homolog [Pedobacter westerhofensis]|uniref:Ketosteroid isomerase homolog n=1 Tax=Pedobacter westerhofensis TaxID=425512 RepID=A0A521FN76_9SPHI|nr:nuclear transport factor 2 family protein [Pedobacter westerhofensis]SMO96911.1 Ketosteroid isomerase homolog [Pedobacter westerhofensis]
MNNHDQTLDIRNTLTDYAKTLNTADKAAIPGFYTSDGKFMPEGYKTLGSFELLKSSGDYLKDYNFKIEYSIQDIVIDNHFAFVVADAKTSEKDPVTGITFDKQSRDFFVFKKIADQWKIYRYLFNKVKNI